MIFISMSKEKEIIDIISLYDSILENKEMVEVSDIYDNVDFKDNVVGNSKPSQDTINTSLLQDVQTAARNAGVVVNVTTAVSGHGTDSPTRHTSGNAVDISMINNKAVSGSNRIDADKFVDALVRLGYSKNVESGNPKAVLTFGFPGHDNHVHVSNNSGQSSETTNSSASEKAYNDATGKSNDSNGSFWNNGEAKDTYMQQTVQSLANKLLPGDKGLKEQREFGNNITNRYGRIIIPKDTNSKIKSPASGVVDNSRYVSGCVNQIIILTKSKHYLQFCGISKPLVRNGQSISIGTLLGNTDTDVEVTMFDDSWSRVPIQSNSTSSLLNKNSKDDKKNDSNNLNSSFWNPDGGDKDPLVAMAAYLPAKIIDKVFGDKYDEKTGERTQKRWGGVADKQPVDPWLLDLIKSPFKTKKVTENIERIKKLL